MAWQYDRDILKLPCGHYRDDSSGPDNQDRFTAIPRVCWRCAAAGSAADRRRQNATKADAKHGLFFEIHDHGQEEA